MKTFPPNTAQAKCGYILYSHKVEGLPSSVIVLTGHAVRLPSKYLFVPVHQACCKSSSETLHSEAGSRGYRDQSLVSVGIGVCECSVPNGASLSPTWKAHGRSVKKRKWWGGVLGTQWSGPDIALVLMNSRHTCLSAQGPHTSSQPKSMHGWGRPWDLILNSNAIGSWEMLR